MNSSITLYSVPITITGFELEIHAIEQPRNEIVGLVNISMIQTGGIKTMIFRGLTIRAKHYAGKPPQFILKPPMYKSGYRYYASVIFQSKTMWKDIEKKVLASFDTLTGGVRPADYLEEQVDPDDIPI